MPKKLKGKQLSREAVEAYHRKKLKMFEEVLEWSDEDYALQEFLDDDYDNVQEPPVFSKFRKAYKEDVLLGKEVNVFQRNLDHHSLKLMAKEYRSKNRVRFYCKTLRGRIDCMSEDVVLPPLSNLDLEQLYEYSLYKKGCEQQGFKIISFKTWLRTPASSTFYGNLG